MPVGKVSFISETLYKKFNLSNLIFLSGSLVKRALIATLALCRKIKEQDSFLAVVAGCLLPESYPVQYPVTYLLHPFSQEDISFHAFILSYLLTHLPLRPIG